jgi:L-amino acid N-acyltransferase YncA
MDLASRYPRTLRIGEAELTFRPMTAEDAGGILEFGRALPDEDLLFLRSDITQPEGVAYWVSNLENGTTTTILAMNGDRVAGYASIHRSAAPWTRRVGEIRVNVAREVRARGLGKQLVNEIFDVARSLDLKKLSAQMTVEQTRARNIFRDLGFRAEAVLADWVEDRNGRSRDLLVMTYDLDGLTDQVDEPLRL